MLPDSGTLKFARHGRDSTGSPKFTLSRRSIIGETKEGYNLMLIVI
jgi:hypothetical protein